MGTFKTTSKTENTQFTYANDTLNVTGSYEKDIENGRLKSVNGQVYKTNATGGGNGQYVGTFNGTTNSGSLKYSLPSEMSREDAMAVWEIIDEIEPKIVGSESEE
ncbi:MAG: hypothetical protein IJ588_12595 [Prevotella sp.]|nr:hypothetical protein [Prevotella sp.]